MILLDVNVVVAAYRADHPHHEQVRPWFEAVLEKGERFTVPDTVWASFIRIVTNRRIFSVPSSATDAFSFLRAVRSAPAHLPIVPGERHLALFETACTDDQAIGDLVPDAYLAALTIEQGAAIATLDRDFGRFTGLRTVRPAV